MAKQEYDKTPLEVEKVHTERLQNQAPWALAVASTGLNILGDNFKKNKPVEFEKLQNWIAEQLVIAKHKDSVLELDYGPMTVGLARGEL
jgi:hypothetical protein